MTSQCSDTMRADPTHRTEMLGNAIISIETIVAQSWKSVAIYRFEMFGNGAQATDICHHTSSKMLCNSHTGFTPKSNEIL